MSHTVKSPPHMKAIQCAREKLALRLRCPLDGGEVNPCYGNETAYRCRKCSLKFIITNPSACYPT